MMAQVVATGTAAGRGLPPGTYAKTGTAQYGSGHPLPTDAWLIGFNGEHRVRDGGPSTAARAAPPTARSWPGSCGLLHQG